MSQIIHSFFLILLIVIRKNHLCSTNQYSILRDMFPKQILPVELWRKITSREPRKLWNIYEKCNSVNILYYTWPRQKSFHSGCESHEPPRLWNNIMRLSKFTRGAKPLQEWTKPAWIARMHKASIPFHPYHTYNFRLVHRPLNVLL